MNNVQTMDLNESGASMMVPLTQPPPSAQQSPPEKNVEYNSNPPPPQTSMDSTPIADIMSMNEVQPGVTEDPRAAMMQQQQQVPQMMMQQQQQVPQMMVAAAAPAVGSSKYPMNLTDEQAEALFVGLVAVIAFSKPLQEKLATMVPKFVGENGSRSVTGLATTGVVAAALFYFGRRAVLKH